MTREEKKAKYEELQWKYSKTFDSISTAETSEEKEKIFQELSKIVLEMKKYRK